MEGYGTRSVSAVTGLSLRQIDYWDRTHFIKPSVASPSGRGTRRLYDFVDLIQFRVAAALREQGISLQKIRKCVIFLKKNKQELAQPLASLKFLTDGESVFVLTADRKVVMDILGKGQLVFSIAIGALLRDLKGKLEEIARPRTYRVELGRRRFTAILHPDTDAGGFWVECPELPGCVSQGETVEESLSMIRDAIRGHLSVMEKETGRRKAV